MLNFMSSISEAMLSCSHLDQTKNSSTGTDEFINVTNARSPKVSSIIRAKWIIPLISENLRVSNEFTRWYDSNDTDASCRVLIHTSAWANAALLTYLLMNLRVGTLATLRYRWHQLRVARVVFYHAMYTFMRVNHKTSDQMVKEIRDWLTNNLN